MTLVLRARADITLDAFYRVAWRGEEVRFDPEALARMAACREAFLGLLESDRDLVIYGVTSGYGQLNIQGPKSRALLQSLTSVDLSNEAFPFRTVREIDIGLARVMCVRITYAGELGYELNIPSEQAVHVYDRIVEAGEVELLVLASRLP